MSSYTDQMNDLYIDKLIAEYKLKIAQLERMKSTPGQGKWRTVAEMFQDLNKLPKDQPKPEPTLEEIDNELDIIRGIKPTPAGYQIKPERMKELMRKRKELAGAR